MGRPRKYPVADGRFTHFARKDKFIDYFGRERGEAFSLPDDLLLEFYAKYSGAQRYFADKQAEDDPNFATLARYQAWYDLYNDAEPYHMSKAREWLKGEMEKWDEKIANGMPLLECIQRTAIDLTLLKCTGTNDSSFKHLLYSCAMVTLRAVEEGMLVWRDNGCNGVAETKAV